MLHAPKSYATYDSSDLISDSVFTDKGSMNAGDIQNFLASKGSGLANYSDTENCRTIKQPYSGTYFPHCGSSVSAATIIYDAAQAFGINPRAIIATLQKEQSLITTPNPTQSQLDCAMGYLSCDSDASGFFHQIDRGTWQFRTNIELMNGRDWWSYTPASYPCKNGHDVNPSNNLYSTGLYPGRTVTFYNPGGSARTITLANSATASLYCYTPHVGPYSETGYSGSYNFVVSYEQWFGSTRVTEEGYSFVTSSATALHYNPGGTGTVTVVLKNISLGSWYSDHNLPAGKQPTRLATIGYQNSPFITPDANSLFTQNQVLMTPDVVNPGENATFTFDVTSPYQVLAWHHRLVPIVGGAFLRDAGIDAVLYADTPAWQFSGSSIETANPLPNQQTQAHFSVLNNSGSSWYSDNNLPAGKQPTRLATVGYQNSPFADVKDPNWLGTRNQIKMTPDVVAPGQTAHFDAYFIGPINTAAQTISDFHFYIVEGGVLTEDKGCTFRLTTPAANLSYAGVSATNPPATMSPGQTSTVSFTLKNTGNVVWHDEIYSGGAYALRLMMNHPSYRNSVFYDSTDSRWLAANQIAKPTDTTWPGQTVTFTFNWKAPSQTGSYVEPFQPIVSGNFMQDTGLAFRTTVQ